MVLLPPNQDVEAKMQGRGWGVCDKKMKKEDKEKKVDCNEIVF